MASIIRPNSFSVNFFDEQAARRNLSKTKSHVVAYARLSFDEDGANFCSIINQQNILQTYYNNHLASPVSTFTFIADDNVSGYKFEREGLFKLLKMIESGECNVIIAKDLSRIGRHGALVQLFIEQCERAGIRVVAMEDYDSNKQSDEMILGIKAWSNERLVKDTSAKIKKIIDHKQKDGTWLCAVPYGYVCKNYQTGIVEIDDPAAEIIHLIDKMYLDDDMGCKSIARELTIRKIPTPSIRAKELNIALGRKTNGRTSSVWSCGQIYKMLKDDFYSGTLRTGKYTRLGINGMDTRTSESSHNVFENHHPAIRTKETQIRIQQKMNDKKSTFARATKSAPNKYRGKIWCGDCGAAMFTMNKEGVQQHYVCGKYFRFGKLFCSRHSIKTKTIDAAAIALIAAIRDNCKEIIDSLDKEFQLLKKDSVSTAHTIESMRKQLESLNSEIEIIEIQRIKRIAASPEREDSINDIYDKMVADNQAEITSLNERIAELEQAEVSYSKISRDLKHALNVIDHIIESNDITRTDVELLFERIEVYEDGRVVVSLKPDLSFISAAPIELSDAATNQKPKRFSVSYVNEVSSGSPFDTSLTNFSKSVSPLISIFKQMNARRKS